MLDVKAKMQQIRFPQGFRPRLTNGTDSAPSPLAVFNGSTSKGKEKKIQGMELVGKEKRGERVRLDMWQRKGRKGRAE